MPSLVQLDLAMNKLHEIGAPSSTQALPAHATLRQLNMDENLLVSWEDCMGALAHFPQ
jgi:hypothetical protein